MRRFVVLLLVCSLLGFALAIGLSFLIGHSSFGPELHQIAESPQRASMPDRIDHETSIMVLETTGFGFRSLEFRAVNPVWTRDSDQPRFLSRRFLTILGWPQLMVTTSSRVIGIEKSTDTDGWRMDDADGEASLAAAAPLWRLDWSGSALNWLAFTLPLVALALRRTPFVWHGVALAAGLWMTLLMAWGCFVLHHWGPDIQWGCAPQRMQRSHTFHTTDPAVFVERGWDIQVPDAAQPWTVFEGHESESFGYLDWGFAFRLTDREGTTTVATIHRGEGTRLGWPLHCLEGSSRSIVLGGFAEELFQAMQLPVSWPGLLGDWFLVSTAVFVFIRSPRLIRQWWRHRRGLCPACGYPAGSSEVCTECGKPVKPRSVKPAPS